MSSRNHQQDKETMNCAEFQAKLPELFESGVDVSNDPHVKAAKTALPWCATLNISHPRQSSCFPSMTRVQRYGKIFSLLFAGMTARKSQSAQQKDSDPPDVRLCSLRFGCLC